MIISLESGAFSLGELAKLLGCEISSNKANMFPKRLVTNSKEVCKGDLFCALSGLRDGHFFIGEAVQRGAIAVLCEKSADFPTSLLAVSSVKEALAKWAIAATKESDALRIGITGSVGKTTLKDATAALLSTRFRVHATYQNHNNDLGLPFTLLCAPRESEVLICELGINHEGEMAPLSRILRPHISAITCIGHAHIGAFGTREKIAEEKREILRHAEERGTVLVPTGEPLLSFVPPYGIQRRTVTPFSTEDYQRHALPASEADIPRDFALAFASAIGNACGLTAEEITLGLHRADALQKRRKEEKFADFLLIDDGYNASPESMISALLYLHKTPEGRRVAVLGDMLELGERSAAYHRAVGRFASTHADRLFFFGAYAKEYAEGAAAIGNGTRCIILRGNKETMAKQIVPYLKGNESILFKASRAVKVEEMIMHLKKELS